MTKRQLSRRGFLQAAAVAGGAAIGSRIGGQWLPKAEAANERSVLLALYLNGGYNACFGSADSFQNKAFSVNDANVMPLGNGLVVDQSTLGSTSAYARSHMASIGVRHGITDHFQAHVANWMENGRSNALKLASAMGGDGAIKAPVVGYGLDDLMEPPVESGISLQRINDMRATIDALGNAEVDPRVATRAHAATGLTAAEAMSKKRLGENARSLGTVREGYATAIGALKKPPRVIDFAEIATAYGHPTNATSVSPFELRSKLVAAELMIHAGANVVSLVEYGYYGAGLNWDTHGSVDATRERNMMETGLMPLLNTFLNRMMNQPDLNVVVCLFGDFARNLDNDHAGSLTATVIGKYVQVGTTGRMGANAELPPGTPGPKQLWAYLAKVLRVPGEPFGANPHGLVVA